MTQRPYRRERHAMPDDVTARLAKSGLKKAYDARPPYQRNDYIGWILQAKRLETREKRIGQMLDELARRCLYEHGLERGWATKTLGKDGLS